MNCQKRDAHRACTEDQTDRIADREQNRIIMHLVSVCLEPHAADEVEHYRTDEPEQLRMYIECRHGFAVHVEREDQHGEKSACGAKLAQEFRVLAPVSASGCVCF